MTREEYIKFANALKNNYTIDFDKLPEFCDMAISALSEIKRNWIPVSERLPKDEEDVLVYCEQYFGQGTVKIAYYHHDYTFYSIEFKDLNETGWYDENDDAMFPEPIAWQPLPEPYKPEKTETCKGCLEPCIMYEADMRGCKKKVTERGE